MCKIQFDKTDVLEVRNHFRKVVEVTENPAMKQALVQFVQSANQVLATDYLIGLENGNEDAAADAAAAAAPSDRQ